MRTSALLTVAQVAARLGCHPETVRRRITSRELGAVRDRGLLRVSEEELARYLAARTSPPVGSMVASRRGASSVPRSTEQPLRRPNGQQCARTLFDEPDLLPPAA